MYILDLIILIGAINGYRKPKKPREQKTQQVIVTFLILYTLFNVWLSLKVDSIMWGCVAIDVIALVFTFLNRKKAIVTDQKAVDDEASLRLYRACLGNGVEKCDSDEDRNNIRLVARSLKIDESKAIAYFQQGVVLYQKEQEQKALEQREKEIKSTINDVEDATSFYEDDLKWYNMTGKDKYLQPYIEDMLYFQKAAGQEASAIKGTERMANALYREKNSSIAGGLAQGIGGIGAGLAAYARTEQSNAAVRQAKSDFISLANNSHIHFKVLAEEKLKPLPGFIEYFSKWLDDVVIDDRVDPSEVNVEFHVDGKEELYHSGFLAVRIYTTDENTYTVINQPARLDGNFIVEVYDEGKKVGTGHYSAFGFGVTDLSTVGFATMMKARRVVIKPEPGIKLSAEKDYEFRFVPDYIWKVQAKKTDPEVMKKFIDQGLFVYDERNGDHRIYTIGSFDNSKYFWA